MRPLGRGNGAATIVAARTRCVERESVRGRNCGIVAMVRVADTAGMRRGSIGRQRERDESPGQREQQQEYGSTALHVFQVDNEPQLESV